MAVTADGELWARAVAGEAAAFGELFERHAKRVYNFCFRQTANWAEAEDATAEVFLVAWKRRESVELTTGARAPVAAKEQDVLAVCAWAGLSYEEGAVALGVPVGTVRSRLSRARAHIRELSAANGHDVGDERVARAADDRRG